MRFGLIAFWLLTTTMGICSCRVAREGGGDAEPQGATSRRHARDLFGVDVMADSVRRVSNWRSHTVKVWQPDEEYEGERIASPIVLEVVPRGKRTPVLTYEARPRASFVIAERMLVVADYEQDELLANGAYIRAIRLDAPNTTAWVWRLPASEPGRGEVPKWKSSVVLVRIMNGNLLAVWAADTASPKIHSWSLRIATGEESYEDGGPFTFRMPRAGPYWVPKRNDEPKAWR